MIGNHSEIDSNGEKQEVVHGESDPHLSRLEFVG